LQGTGPTSDASEEVGSGEQVGRGEIRDRPLVNRTSGQVARNDQVPEPLRRERIDLVVEDARAFLHGHGFIFIGFQ
jgi:hypothetical protein